MLRNSTNPPGSNYAYTAGLSVESWWTKIRFTIKLPWVTRAPFGAVRGTGVFLRRLGRCPRRTCLGEREMWPVYERS